MKKLLMLLAAVAFAMQTDAQVLKRLANRAKNKMEQKAGDKVDRKIDDATDGQKKEKKKPASEDAASPGDGASNSGQASQSQDANGSSTAFAESDAAEDEPALKTFSKYDFIPGEKLIAFEDFNGTEIGDFPMRWNTNASAEVVNLNSKPGKWMKMNKQGVFHPEFITELPENFTLEFDLGVNDNWNSYPFAVNIVQLTSPDDFSKYGYNVSWTDQHSVHLNMKPAVSSSKTDGMSAVLAGTSGKYNMDNSVRYSTWDHQQRKMAHVSVWRQSQRLRVYLNGEKIWDIPRVFETGTKYNAITFGVADNYADGDFYVLSNIRLAAGVPDTRTKLINEGKFVTRGILFDVNKAEVKAESYGVLKDIAKVLAENPDVKVQIVGHTDSDGDDAANMELSKKRAEAVKAALAAEFGIDASRLTTDGKGESQPVDKNDSAIGKANNRRVEFIKK